MKGRQEIVWPLSRYELAHEKKYERIGGDIQIVANSCAASVSGRAARPFGEEPVINKMRAKEQPLFTNAVMPQVGAVPLAHIEMSIDFPEEPTIRKIFCRGFPQ